MKWGAQVLFLSTYVNKVDRKGRVSVPAHFRAVLSGQDSQGIVGFRSFKHPALDCSGQWRVAEMAAQLDTLSEFSEEYEALEALFADMRTLSFDAEGRIILPDDVIELTGITETVAFVGLSKKFQIWEPETYKAHQQTMRQLARDKKLTLPAVRTNVPSPGSVQ